MSRRELFREYMANLSRTAAETVEGTTYVAPQASTGKAISSFQELNPTAAQLVVGGIGAGKTTELLVARSILNQLPDITAEYIDASLYQDLGRLRVGCLFALVGLRILERLGKEAPSEGDSLRDWANGYVDDQLYAEDDDSRVPGVITPPRTEWPDIPEHQTENLRIVLRSFERTNKRFVAVVDSFDRVTDLDNFSSLVHQDVAAIRALRVGLVIVGPPRSIFGALDSEILRFDKVMTLPAVDPQSESGRDFLRAVLGGIFRRCASRSPLLGKVGWRASLH